MLREELGLEPGPELGDRERRILDHDPGLSAPSVVTMRLEDAAGGDFVGRERELGEMLVAYREAADDAQFVVLEGDAGIGKTRLATEFAAIVAERGSLTAWARTDELGAAPALWPWLDVLRAVIPRVDSVPAVLDGLLAADTPLLPGRGALSQFERFDAIAAVLEQAGADSPVVVLLDDLQWCDPTSLDLLRFLVARLQRGVLVVVTVRALEVGRADDVTDALGAIARRPGSRRLRIGGISIANTRDLLDAHAAEPISEDLSRRIFDRAEGNPFYTLELARLLEEPGAVGDEVPATVRDAVRHRLSLLPGPTLDLLATAAVIGRDVDLPLVAGVAAIELDECVDLLDPAAEHRVLVLDPAFGSLRFSHGLVREVLVDDLTPLRRSQLHLRVADVIEHAALGDDDIEVLADHLWRAAALGVGQRAADALERAADRAVGRAAYASAENMLGRAVQLRQPVASTPAAQQALLNAQLRLLEVMQATRHFSGTDRELLHRTQALANRLGRVDAARELTWGEWAALSRRADVAEAGAIAEHYRLRWSDDPRPHVRASVDIVDGVTAWSRGEIGGAIEHLDRAVELLRDAPSPTSPLEREQPLIAATFHLHCHAAHGDETPEDVLDRFDALLDELPRTAVDGRHQMAYALACRTAAIHTRWDTLERLVNSALKLDPVAQFAFFGGQLLLYRALVEARRGDVDLALATFGDGRSRFRAVGGRTGLATCQALLAEQLAQSRAADAAELAAGARQQIIETGEAANEVPVHIAEGVVAFAAGDRQRAAEHLEAAFAVGHRQGAHALADRALAVSAALDLESVDHE
jgi:tetratricopeptide (TPR) repeat protein